MDRIPRGRRVLVLNQFAKPGDQAGSSRHEDLFSRLEGWEFRILIGDRDLYSRHRTRSRHPNFEHVRVLGYERNDGRRVLNWASYCVGAAIAGLRGPRPDVVYGSSPHILAPLTGLLLARARRARFVLEVRDLWPRSLVDLGHLVEGSTAHRVLLAVESLLYRAADHVVIVTDGMREHLLARGVPAEKVSAISNGADPADYGPVPDVPGLRERVPVRGRLLVFAGAHGPKDGLDHVLDAAHERPGDTFVLIGDGTDKPRVMARARSEGLANVHFLDLMPKAELRTILGDADIGLHTVVDVPVFRLGMSPNKLYDYLAAGLAVVTNAPGEPHRVVEAAGAGVGTDPTALAEGIAQLDALTSADLVQWGQRGRDYMARTKSPAVMAQSLQRVLDRLVDPRASASSRSGASVRS